ncbi:hypothetical protein SISSUDRAFT_1055888 [Sistotremastrum suecicum HHB10207 ss-3]|uniref:Uncharacterized protein n=1 Tax=Sistotremastrum suecicum HHB10207 ss-3 TaxID=1314776 RepID=A0A165XG98_9AGAM|nr:hypothetical protein SISSUDRAFT_1055888 [Sistotremastrum suecicum HHB10207 ss-3]
MYKIPASSPAVSFPSSPYTHPVDVRKVVGMAAVLQNRTSSGSCLRHRKSLLVPLAPIRLPTAGELNMMSEDTHGRRKGV